MEAWGVSYGVYNPNMLDNIAGWYNGNTFSSQISFSVLKRHLKEKNVGSNPTLATNKRPVWVFVF